MPARFLGGSLINVPGMLLLLLQLLLPSVGPLVSVFEGLGVLV